MDRRSFLRNLALTAAGLWVASDALAEPVRRIFAVNIDLRVSPQPLTLADWAKRLGPDGKLSRIIEVLNTQNEILDEVAWTNRNSNLFVRAVR